MFVHINFEVIFRNHSNQFNFSIAQVFYVIAKCNIYHDEKGKTTATDRWPDSGEIWKNGSSEEISKMENDN